MPDYGPGFPMFGAQATARERGRSAQRVFGANPTEAERAGMMAGGLSSPRPFPGGAEAGGGTGIGGGQPPAMGGEGGDFDINQLIEALKLMPEMRRMPLGMPPEDAGPRQRMPLGMPPTDAEAMQMQRRALSNPTDAEAQRMRDQYQRMPLR